MLIAISALKGYVIQASDGIIGNASDFLFDDVTWRLRWIEVDLGTWLTDRKLLLHPSAIRRADHRLEVFLTGLTKAQVEASPPIFEHEPVSWQTESRLSTYYGSDPLWGDGIFGADTLSPPLSMGARFGVDTESNHGRPSDVDRDPHLRSTSEVGGYSIKATDGSIGHVENFLIDDEHWDIRFLIVDTRNWWPGKHVLVPRAEIREIEYAVREIKLGLERAQIRAIPPWDPIAMMEKVYDKRVPNRDGWHGVGF